MITILRTDSDNPDFRSLVVLLDKDLAERDGDDHAFYAQYNGVDKIRQAVVAYVDGQAVGIGAIRGMPDAAEDVEVKRMYVLPEKRGKGVAVAVLAELEKWAAELGFKRCVLETGKKQPEAIALYNKSSYAIIPNYGQYANVENSVCMAKEL